MPTSFNPFDEWLGMGPKTVNPHHFQLLNVSPTLTDPEEIAAAVEKGVQHHLDRLAAISPGENSPLVAKLKRRIRIAEETLLDPEKRQSYLKRLQARTKSSRSPQRFKTERPEIPNQPDRSLPKIEVAQSVQSSNPSDSSLRLAPGLHSDSPQIEFKIKTAIKRKRQGRRVPLVVGSAILVAMGLAFTAYYIISAQSVSALADDPKSSSENSNGELNGEPDLPAFPESELEANRMNGDAENDIAANTDAAVPDDDGPAPELTIDHQRTTALPPTIVPKLVELSESQLTLVRRSLDRANRGLARQDVELARAETDRAREILEFALSEEGATLIEEHEPMARMVDASNETADLIERFWGQVTKSCHSIPGGQEIVVKGQVMAFVESKLDGVTLRIAGRNISYPYQSLPPSLAIALANQGAIDDVRLWVVQQAAIYSVSRATPTERARTIEGLLTVAETFGYDCTKFRQFDKSRFDNNGKSVSRLALDDARRISLTERIRSENDYENPQSASPENAAILFEKLFHRDEQDSEIQIAYLYEALQLAVRAGQASLVEDAILEMSIYSDMDGTAELYRSFMKLSNSDKTVPQCRDLLERSIRFLKSNDASTLSKPDRQSLVSQLTRIASQHSMLDCLQAIQRLDDH